MEMIIKIKDDSTRNDINNLAKYVRHWPIVSDVILPDCSELPANDEDTQIFAQLDLFEK